MIGMTRLIMLSRKKLNIYERSGYKHGRTSEKRKAELTEQFGIPNENYNNKRKCEPELT